MEEVEVKRGRPAKADVKATKPGWRPASMLGVLKAPPGFTARWVRNDPANVSKKKAEGWVVMEHKDNHGSEITVTDVNDSGALGKGIVYRDMVAMMLPDEIKAQRDEYHRSENRQALKSVVKDAERDINENGARTYTPKGMQGRLVIE